MRVVENENFTQEKFIRCSKCKKLLAYTKNDVMQYHKNLMLFKVIKCPVCKYENIIDIIDIINIS